MRWIFVLVLALGLAALTGCSGQDTTRFCNTDITGSAIGGSLHGLKDHRGQVRTLDDFRSKAVIVFFGYTSCPDVCPTTLFRFAEVMKQLGREGGRVQVIMVTVDPEHDKPERLAAYVTGFDASFIGLSGDLPATDAVAREFKVFVDRNSGDHHHGAGVKINHSTGTYVFDAAGRVRLYVKDDAPVAAITDDLRRLLALRE